STVAVSWPSCASARQSKQMSNAVASANAEVEHQHEPPIFTEAYGKLPAQEVARAKACYADKLGLRPYKEHAGHLYYEVRGANFIIFPSAGAPSGTHDQPGLVVDDLESTAARLRSRGVTFETYPASPG